MQAELISSLLKGFCMLKERELADCMVEGDLRTVTSWANGKAVGSWQLLHFVGEVRNLARDMQVAFIHPCSKNGATDKLAKWGWG